MEKAIRRLAGTMVLLGLSLGWWVHPGFLWLVAFVGVNLIQSTFTGICPAESILRKLGVGAGEATKSGARAGVRS